MLCNVIPYEGTEPYIFLSYCHKDEAAVYPLLESLSGMGYRVWYDNGNHAGDDWLENIATHLNGCAVCLALVSPNAALSHNCKSEINEAIEWGKTLAVVLLEEFQMPLGMRLQLSTLHYLKRPDYPSDEALLGKLLETESFGPCRDASFLAPERKEMPVPSGPMDSGPEPFGPEMSTPESSGWDTPEEPAPPVEPTVPVPPEKPPVPVVTDREWVPPVPEVPEVPIVPPVPPVPPVPEKESGSYGPTELMGKSGSGSAGQVPATALPTGTKAVLIRLATHKAYPIRSTPIRIGRSAHRCQVVLEENSYIGNCHAEILWRRQTFFLRDMDSTNGTYVNSERIPPETPVELGTGARFRLYDEHFLLATGAAAELLLEGRPMYCLKNVDTGTVRLLPEEQLYLDRSHKWPDGTLNDGKISRKFKHALLSRRNTSLWLRDLGSRNGTFLNGTDLRGQPDQRLKPGDRIRLGSTTLEVGLIELQGE